MSKKYSQLSVFVAACAGMAFFGVTMLSLGPILGPLNATVVGANALPSTLSIGIIIGTLLFGPIVDKFGYKWLTILSSVFALAGVQGLANFGTIGWLHASICMLGIGGGILNGLTNALVSDIYDDDKRGGKLGLLGAFYCVGALLWTLLNVFISDFRIPLNAISIVMALFILFFFFISFPKAKPSEGGSSVSKTLGLLKYPALFLFAFVLFFQSGFEGVSGDFTISYLVKTAQVENSVATLAMTWFTVGMFIGRILLGKIMEKIKELGTLYLYLSVALLGVVGFTLGGANMVIVYTAMACIGFGVGATFPVVLNFVGSAFREMSGTAFSIALFIALCGQTILKRVAGVAFDAANYMLFPVILISALVIIMVLAPIAVKASKKIK